MPDLRDRAVREWILDQGVVLPAEPDSREAQPAERIATKAVDLGDAFDRAAQRRRDHGPIGEGSIESLQLVITRLDRCRRLRLLDWLGSDTATTGLPACMPSGKGEAADFIRQEAFELDRHEILRRLFAPGRLSRLESACELVSPEGHAG